MSKRKLVDIYAENEGISYFIKAYNSFTVSEADVERLFSFFHRCVATFMRKSLEIRTITHLERIYSNLIVSINA